MKHWGRQASQHRWLRFLLGGGINTAFTYGLYLAINTVLGYQPAYMIAYVTGIVFSYGFNSLVVFRVPLTWKGLFSYPLVYVVQYVASALLLGGLVELAGASESIAPLVVIIAMVPATYVMSGLLLGWASKPKLSIESNGVDPRR